MRKLVFNWFTGAILISLAYLGLRSFWQPHTGMGVWASLSIVAAFSLITMFVVAYHADTSSSGGGHGVPTDFAAGVGVILFFPLLHILIPIVAGVAYVVTSEPSTQAYGAGALVLVATWGMNAIPKA